jgi:uroporphyrinogen decarboxylase
MNQRERFHAIMDFRPVDRLPVWYFGQWRETMERWRREGLPEGRSIAEATGMDPDWEAGMWGHHGLVRVGPLPDQAGTVLEDTEDWQIVRTALGAVQRIGKHGSSIPEHLREALEPTRESWNRFRRMLDPDDPQRRPAGWEALAADVAQREGPIAVLGGSLFGWAREWLGLEAISYLSYDDPALYEEIIETVADHFMRLLGPVLERVPVDLAYFFEDCCGRNGPLFSPDTYRRFYDRHYRRMVEFYHSHGVRWVLLDSDGKTDALIPGWLESGIDILFPIEVGVWQADPMKLRGEYGKTLRMMGGIDKPIIPEGEDAIRAQLERLRPVVEEGGYIPLPDHRIPPSCSLEQFRTYVRVFREVFG